MVCVYTFPNGDVVRGKPALKAYLTENLASLLPDRAAKAGFRRTPVQEAIAQAHPPEQRAMVQRMAKGFTARWANPPKLEFFDTLQDANIPEAVRAEDARQRAGGAVGDVEGFYLGGTAYIWNGLKTPEDVQRVTFHEGLGHYGLRGVFGKAINDVLEQITALRRADVIKRARDYNLVKAGINPKTASNAEMWAGMTDAHKLQAAEEVLAFMAQTTPNIGFVRRAVAAIKTWLRQNVPGMADLQLSDAEIIRDYILPARAFVERGGRAGIDARQAAFQRAWHGTPHRGIEKFSTDKIGTGEGAQAYGWGLYFASKREIAEYYRTSLAKRDIVSVRGKDLDQQGGFLAAHLRNIKMDMQRGKSFDAARLQAIEDLSYRKDAPEETAAAIRELEKLGPDDWRAERGQLYEVEIPEDSEMLLWDKPLSEQPEKVRKALEKLNPALFGRAWTDGGVALSPDLQATANANPDKAIAAGFVESNPSLTMSGEQFYRQLSSDGFGDNAFRNGGSKAASEALAALEIKGIKYLDGTSRGAGEGSYNYVIFSGDDVAIQNAMFSRAAGTDQTQTPEFNRWFGDSKVVDAEGRPLVVYHGSSVNRTEFRRDRGNGLSGAFFTSDNAEARDYAEMDADDGGRPRVIGVYLSLQNPYRSSDHNEFQVLTQERRDELEAQGYDGMIGEYEGGAREFIAFRPEQIKSAKGNNGAFDPANPDIRFSRAAPKPTGLTLPEQGLLRRVQAAAQDGFNRVRQVQERIAEITGRPVPEHANYYGAETQRPGRIAARLEDFEKQMTGPLMAKLAKSGHTQEQLSELLHAMHAQERNDAVAKINPDMPDGGSGMTNSDAAAILAKYRTNRELHKLADQARDIAKATLELKLAYGMIKIEDFDALATRYKNYVPLKGDGEYGPKVKRAMGHDEREEHILENLSRDYQQAVVVGEKYLARQAFLAMVLENPDPDFWTVNIPPRGRYVAGTVFSVKKGGQEVATFTSMSQVAAFLEAKGPQAGQYEVLADGERVREFVKPLQDNEVPVYVDGQLVRIQINGDEKLAQQLRPLNAGQMNPILEFMRGVNRYLSKIYTGYNPAFIIRNTTRDAMTGTINILGNEGAGTAAKAWANYPSAMKALFAYAATGKVPTGDTGKMLEEYRQHGGKTGASWMSDLEEQGKTLERLYDDAYGAKGYLADKRYAKAAAVAGRKIVGGMAHSIEVLNQATENGLRLALYMAMRQQGKTPGEAAQAAKSVTVDFDRKGALSPALGAIYLFFNPAVQGTANAMKTLFKGQHKAQAWTALGALAALGFYLASQGMDDDEDRWLGEGWESRAKNMMINIGGHTIKVPISMEFAPMYAFGVAMAEASRNATNKMAAAGHIVSSFIDAYFPLQGAFNSESDNHGMDAAMAAVPTMLKPGVQVAANRNTFGSQVVPENEMTKDRPDNLKMFRGTKGTAYDAAAQGIAAAGEALGAGRYENDLSKVSPETLKLLWRTYTGGLGQFVTDVAGLANVGAADGANLETSDIPVVKDFVKPNDVKAIRGRYYDLTGEARAAAEEFKQAKKAGDGEAIEQIMQRPEKAELLGFDRLIKSTNKAVASIRDEMVDVNADKSLSLAEKRAKLKALEKEEEAIYRDAIAAFR